MKRITIDPITRLEGHGKIEKVISVIPDYAGQFYKYSLPGSILGGKKKLIDR